MADYTTLRGASSIQPMASPVDDTSAPPQDDSSLMGDEEQLQALLLAAMQDFQPFGGGFSAGLAGMPPPRTGVVESPAPDPSADPIPDDGGSTDAAPAPAPQSETDAMATLQRHEGAFSSKGTSLADLQKMADDPDTPSDLRQALDTVLGDPNLCNMLDSGKNGKLDGKISSKDIQALASSPQMVAINQQKAAGYAQNYIPSDDDGSTTTGRPITGNDAENELYAYADNLPKNVSLKDMQDIVDGTGKEGKRPPQLIAAACYFTQHPDQWKSLNGGKDQVSRGAMENSISATGQLDQSETDAVNRLIADPDKVFQGSITRASLTRIVNDPNSDPADKATAQKLLSDPTLFGKLDNGQNGSNMHGWKSLWHQSDDGRISRGDLSSFESKLKNKAVAPTPAAPTAAALNDPDAAAATGDMLAGEQEQPDIKKAKGGALKKFVDGVVNAFKDIGKGFLKIGEGLFHAVVGLGEIVGGALTGNGRLLSAGGNAVTSGLKQTVDGAGDVVEGGADLTLLPSSLIFGDGEINLVNNTIDGATGMLDAGIDGAGKVVGGVVTGNVSEIGQGFAEAAPAALAFIPGEGEVELGDIVAQGLASTVESSGESQAENMVGL